MVLEDFDHLQLGSRRPPTQWVVFESSAKVTKEARFKSQNWIPKARKEENKAAAAAAANAENWIRKARKEENKAAAASGNPLSTDPSNATATHFSTGRPMRARRPPTEAMKVLKEPRDPNLACVAAESHDGNVEYKLQIQPPNAARFQQLTTQMNFRLSEGNGECYYAVGVEDDGYPKGLEEHQLESSLRVLRLMAHSLTAHVYVVKDIVGANGRRCVLAAVKLDCLEDLDCKDLRVAEPQHPPTASEETKEGPARRQTEGSNEARFLVACSCPLFTHATRIVFLFQSKIRSLEKVSGARVVAPAVVFLVVWECPYGYPEAQA
eukprot:gene7098-201_t